MALLIPSFANLGTKFIFDGGSDDLITATAITIG